ncbi:hypothetical protein BDV96DRAFT_285526 [Lophiotrema nucula]|uniref:Zn(2)-C6 fungal-type domain-containing protein n=1 Tax=Lophiotrema nucula TaxID=690887 RepID=A0A6A5YPA9_9PLEO|nr:hypothetical protein BDV96DRAFT_285526 [Lophiotrema nucula]
MSYRGRPSKGCESCRARKVKCDETKPTCNRCSKSGHECRYRDQADLLFRNQTAFAAQKAEESWRKRSKSHQRAESESSIQSIHSNQHSPGSSKDSPPATDDLLILSNLSIGPDPQADLRRAAYDRFKYDFVVHQTPGRDPSIPSDSLWTFIPELYERAAEGSCLRVVVDAAALANLSSRQKIPQASVLGEEYLGKGIKLLQKAIADKKQAASDEVLATVYLLGVYENLTSSKHNGTYLAHKEGANALLKLRSINDFFKDPLSARLYEVSFSQMVRPYFLACIDSRPRLIFWQQLIGNLQSSKPPTLPIRDLAAARQFLPNMHSVSGMYVVQLIHNEAHLHAKWHELKYGANPPATRRDLRSLLQEALDLDAEFQAWESTTPPQWKYKREMNTPEFRAKHDPKWTDHILGGSGAPSEIHTCSSLKQAWVWMFYRTTRIFVLRDLIEILNWMLKLPEPEATATPEHDERIAIATGKAVITPIDNVSLLIHHAFTTTHLVTIIEKSCCAILGHFTVPIYGKTTEDVVGIRGYTSLWPLGVMDAILRMGLVPDSGAITPPQPESSQLNFNPFHNMPAPSPNLFRMPEQNRSPLYHDPSTAQIDPDDFPRLDHISSQCVPSIPDVTMYDFTQAPQPLDPTLPRSHAFDSGPLHPFSMPSELPSISFTPPQPSKIDVKARREWIHQVLLYMGNELGIKKGLAVLQYAQYTESKNVGIESAHGVTPESAQR